MLQKIIIAIAILVIGFSIGKWMSGSDPSQSDTVNIHSTPKTIADDEKAITQAKITGPFSYAAAVKMVAPSVVNIHTKTKIKQNRSFFNDPIFDLLFGKRPKRSPRERLQTSLGSGVIVSDQGYILTNNHVIRNADTIMISLHDGRKTAAKLIGADPDTDLAVLKVDLKQLPAVVFANSENIEVGDVTLAIGNPFGVGKTVTMGIVSATGRSELGIANLENFIQTDASINPGNSGGALANAKGELIGLNIAIYSKSGASHGIGFAIPANTAKKVLEQIIKHGGVKRAWVGVETQDLTEELASSFAVNTNTGVVVSGVYADSPAKKAGIKPGDILTHLNDQHIANSVDWKQVVINLKPGDEIKIKALRQGEEYQLTIQTSLRPTGLR